MHTNGKLDWLTITGHTTRPQELLPRHEIIKIIPQERGAAHYQNSAKVRPGGYLAWSDNDRQGARFALGGSDLDNWRDIGMTDEIWTSFICHENLACSRLDFAIDVMGDGKALDTRDEYEAERCVTAFRSSPLVIANIDESSGTCYFGSRNSDRFIRIYDKAAQQKIMNCSWTRIELVLKNKRSNALVKDAGTKPLALCAKQIIRDVLQFPDLAWYQAAISGEQVELLEVPRAIPKTERWLIEQVKPAIKKYADLGSAEKAFVRDWLWQCIDAIEKKG